VLGVYFGGGDSYYYSGAKVGADRLDPIDRAPMDRKVIYDRGATLSGMPAGARAAEVSPALEIRF